MPQHKALNTTGHAHQHICNNLSVTWAGLWCPAASLMRSLYIFTQLLLSLAWSLRCTPPNETWISALTCDSCKMEAGAKTC